jgi:release factor glutamine methyltransferase
LVIANLPYLTSAEVDAAGGSVEWEPRAALDGGADGLDLLRRLIAELPRRLRSDGVALLEIGAGQAGAVRAAVSNVDRRTALTTLRDLAAIERVVRIARV